MSTNTDARVSSEPPSNNNINAVTNSTVTVDPFVAGDNSLDSKTQTLVDDSRVSGGDIAVQDVIDHVKVSVDEKGIVINDNNDVVLDKSVSVDRVKIGDESLGSKTERLTVKQVDDRSGDGDMVVKDSVVDSRVCGDETAIVMSDNSEVVLDEQISDAVVSSELPSNGDVDAVNGVNIGDYSLGLKAETLTMKPSADDHNGDGDIVVRDSVDDSRVCDDEKGIVTNSGELVLDKPISDAAVSSEPMNDRDIDAVNGVKIGADSLGSETETPTMKPSDDHNEDGDNVVQASRDEKGTVTENIEKVSDENEVINEEKEGEYKVTDIVWAKVKNYPWWPGQIFDRSAATEKAKKFSNKKGHLIGYFGDQSFAWNKPPNIKPFRKNFHKLEKQSTSKPFLHAVNCALDEVARRVEFGLACSCLSKEVYDKIKSQRFVSAGIREEDSKIDGGDRFSTVSTFKPVKAVQSVQELAREHFDGFSRLEALSVRTQLLAFFRWKGRNQLKPHDIVDELDNKLEEESELPLTEEKMVVEDEKLASLGKKTSSKKRKPDDNDSDSDDSIPLKKERSLTNATPKGNSSAKKTPLKKRKPDDSYNDSDRASGSDSDDSIPLKKKIPLKKNGSLTKVTPKGNLSAKKNSSKTKKPDDSDSDDSVPLKKNRSLTHVTPKGNSSAKRSKKGISKKATVEDNVIKEENGNEKPDSVDKKVSSKKRKQNVSDSDDSVPRKKEKSSTKMISKGSSSVKKSKNNVSKKATLKDNVSKEENGNGTDDKKSSISSPKMFRVGDSICRIAKQLSESPTILKKESEKSKTDEDSATLRETAKKDGQPMDKDGY
ncbi:hypothetical protein M8C21_024903 [Ambrosia artemisiifolia]|uniref:PWWP domain-containing protein n=1 Tax=Ambrosia artemisiifolia TaxID=4212 RepID=A0AAD5D051_AMBAR|nr:hypothetical protein M8C21_024903 [Ambrosia artemisiifolia]